MKILVLGATGMLGSAVLQTFHGDKNFEVFGTIRNENSLRYFPDSIQRNLFCNVNVLEQDALIDVFQRVKPQVVINCIGLIKQLSCANDPLVVLPINSIFPHRLAKLCGLMGIRLIHISTDCVFSGLKGNYLESDVSDAKDLYGKSKFIGEISDLLHVFTIRTSIIGHEFNKSYSLIDWFLSQNNEVKGYSKAIFSGLPTVEIARVMRDYIIPNPTLYGLYHVAAQPINKYDLLGLVSEIYKKKIIINFDDQFIINRALNATRFNKVTGYIPPQWPQLIERMHQSKSFYRR